MTKSTDFDDSKFIAHILVDISRMHEEVYNLSCCERDYAIVAEQCGIHGISFLTKTCAVLGKAFDRALTGATFPNASTLGFATQEDSCLPIFMGELFGSVLTKDGTIRENACPLIVRSIRQVTYLYYKYGLPYTDEQEQLVIQKFERTEDELSSSDVRKCITDHLDDITLTPKRHRLGRKIDQGKTIALKEVTREAKYLLSRLFGSFDPYDIYPGHGPGAVAEKQKPWHKFSWTNIAGEITQRYPLDSYYYASMGAVCDHFKEIQSLDEQSLSARVILVPKDSRGPRLISAEPKCKQWIQQGLSRAIVDLVERHPLTKWNVHFTDQAPNQRGALLGSSTGRYATLDLNEASDRVSLDLVRLLFPENITVCLEACRSSSTCLPDGRIIKLKKYAPMGSSLCFPVLALTVWAILTAGATDEDTRDGILVYGDDVIVPTAYAERAIELLESYGLKINQDKSCTSGFFRESCGVDAFKGVNVTPVRLRTVWSSSLSAHAYPSWVAYANLLWDKQYYSACDYIARRLHHIYGAIPSRDMGLKSCPSLPYVPEHLRPRYWRVNRDLQKIEWFVRCVGAPVITRHISGWRKLLRYFSEKAIPVEWDPLTGKDAIRLGFYSPTPNLTVSEYTQRGEAELFFDWR